MMKKRPTLMRGERQVHVTDEEKTLLDELWVVGHTIRDMEEQLVDLKKRREVLAQDARKRRFLLREIAEIGCLSQAGANYLVQESGWAKKAKG